LLDRLGARLGLDALSRLEARESHIPEKASVAIAMGEKSPSLSPKAEKAGGRPEKNGAKPPRPVRLFDPPEPVEAWFIVPDDPPFRFAWRRRAHAVSRADGPERIAEEWWVEGASGGTEAIRDYYRVEDAAGRRFWLFRAGLAGSGSPPRWFLHGIFA
jgi:protein ImuB